MKKLSKEQQALLECALEKLYSFLKKEYKVDYHSSIRCIMYNDIVRLFQCSCDDGVAWFADIGLQGRWIFLSTRNVEREYVYSKFDYDLFYMSDDTKIHTMVF